MSVKIVAFRPSDNADWFRDAACATPVGPSPMFPSDGDEEGILRAKAICHDCPVWRDCLSAALARNEQYGIWGGTTPDERSSARRKAVRKVREAGKTAVKVKTSKPRPVVDVDLSELDEVL